MPIIGPTIDHVEIRSWANRNSIVPTELFPHRVDHEPALLQLMPASLARQRKDLRLISWEEFFARFDLLGLAFIYDDEASGYNELLQRDEKAPRLTDANRREVFKH